MEKLGNFCFDIFYQSVQDYHFYDDVRHPCTNPFPESCFQYRLYSKNWIDTIQWHMEDLIRDPEISPKEGLAIKREIDRLNQQRTDIVESIDDHLFDLYKDIKLLSGATINTESLGWAIDRLSILALKLYHIHAELLRKNCSKAHILKCKTRLIILLNQKEDLIRAIDWLLEDIRKGNKIIRVYRQLKMYNETDFNPVLYAKL